MPIVTITQANIPTSLTSHTTYELIEDITLTANFTYSFDISGVTFNGNGHTITVYNRPSFNGLIYGTSGSANDLQIDASGTTTLSNNCGWFFNRTARGTATNCVSTGSIPAYCGGIFGFGMNSFATNCHSTGSIGIGAGGIFAINSPGTATNCYSTGNILSQGGGIFGLDAYYGASAINCYSTGDIRNGGGGIFGSGARSIGPNSESATLALNCYSTGNLSAIVGQALPGGIFGSLSGGIARNCFSTGAIGQNCGGIFGSQSNGFIQATTGVGPGTAINCYSSGLMVGNTTGAAADGIFGVYDPSAGNINKTNSGHSEGWSDLDASRYLQISDVAGNAIWLNTSSNTPFSLAVYSVVNVAISLLSQHSNESKTTYINSNIGVPTTLSQAEGQALADSSPYKADNVTITGPVTVFCADEIAQTIITVDTPVDNMGFVIPSGTPYTLTISDISKLIEYNDNGTLTVDGAPYVVGNTIVWSPSLSFILATLGLITFQQTNTQNVPCFPTGTRILTTEGYKPVETLASDDRIQTADGRALAFKLYSRTVIGTKETAPYKIRRGAFGSTPVNDITLSPLHAIQSRNNVWQIPRYAAINNSKVVQYGIGTEVKYYHIELPNYFTDNIVAEGSVVESFGGKQAKGMKTVYKYSERLGGFTRANKNLTLSASK